MRSRELKEKYSSLLILSRGPDKVYPSGQRKQTLECLCDCGTRINTLKSSILNGTTKSCGCYRRNKLNTHNLSKSKLYNVWDGMLQRCPNEKHPNYKYYGGRGITVCDPW